MLCLAAGCGADYEPPSTALPLAPAEFLGSTSCESCHSAEYAQWRGSHHQLAMQEANAESVLGDFSGVTIDYFDTEATFSQRDGAHIVATDNGAGEQQEFEVTHVFGVTPLQQYLVDAPGGRKQALQYAWDSRPASDGGQRWFHLYPDEYVAAGDVLHWTGRYFNWNTMCAECHSTDLDLGYDTNTNSFATTFSEISVGCEACHGPGSQHVTQADNELFDDHYGLQVDLDDRNAAAWIMNIETGIAERSSSASPSLQAESCGRCHSRRSVVASEYEYGKLLTETHLPSLLEENLYHPDGRIQDEVYVYGSFLQSKMYAAGVTCTDCHNAHSGELHAGPNPNDTCATCHLTTKFATTDHAQDRVGDCVSCHMPATTYMGVDDRRDHSFRLPNTSDDADHYGAIIAAGRNGNANSDLLAGIANDEFPNIARATMLTLLQPLEADQDASILVQQLDSSDPLLRIGALRALRVQAPELLMRSGSHLLRDPVRSVRTEAVATYVDYRDLLPIEDSRAFASAADDYRQAMQTSIAVPDAALNLAAFEARLGNPQASANWYEHALRVGPDSAAVQHLYGLHLVRSGRATQALEHLRQATQLEASNSQFVYIYGVALNSLGQAGEALNVLRIANEQFPESFDIAWALATIHRDAGNRDAALAVSKQLAEQFPDDARVDALINSLANPQ